MVILDGWMFLMSQVLLYPLNSGRYLLGGLEDHGFPAVVIGGGFSNDFTDISILSAVVLE